MKKIFKSTLLSALILGTSAVALGVLNTCKVPLETHASASDDSYYYIVGDFNTASSNSPYKSLGSWNISYNATQKELAGVQNHHSKIYTLIGGWYKSGEDWPYYADNFKFFDITNEWNDSISYEELHGTAASYFKTNNDKNIIAKSDVVDGGFNMDFSIKPDVTNDSKSLTIEHVYHFAGTSNGWNPAAQGATTLVANGDKVEMTFALNAEFKFTNYDRNEGRGNRWLNTLTYSNLGGNAAHCFIEGVDEHDEGNGNIKCKTAGTYSVYVEGSTLKIDFADMEHYCYHGTASSWAEYTGTNNDHVITVGGAAVEFTFASGEMFKFAPKGAGDWGPVELNWNNFRTDETIDDVDYAYYRCFAKGTGTNDKNIICRKAGTYLVSIDSNLRLSFVASNENTKNTYYVLDLNGNLFTGEYKSANAHFYINDQLDPQVSTEFPGFGMTKVSNTNNIFGVDAWEDLDTVIFNDGSSETIGLSLSGNTNKVLILTWAMENSRWTSSQWVSLDAAKFIDEFMKFETAHQDNSGSGACKTEHWYSDAKTAYEGLSSSLKEEISGVSIVTARLSAWATANGETFSINNSVGSFSNSNVINIFNSQENSFNTTVVILVVLSMSLFAIGGIALSRKKSRD